MSTDTKPKAAGRRQYYIATGTEAAKLTTLVDLLRALLPSAPLTIGICCSSRDTLDAVCGVCLDIPNVQLHVLHANLSEVAIADVARTFRAASASQYAAGQGAVASEEPGSPSQEPKPAPCLHVLATTDPPLLVLPSSLRPVGLTLLLNYDLPRSKTAGQSREAALAQKEKNSSGAGPTKGGPPSSVISFVVAGAVAEFRAYEQAQGQSIDPVPIQVEEILQPSQDSDRGSGWRTR